jgi:hypothetical protein
LISLLILHFLCMAHSRLVSRDAFRDKDRERHFVGTIVVPERFRTIAGNKLRGTSIGEGEGDNLSHICPRVEGMDALTWLCSDMSTYVTIVTDTVSHMLPKMTVVMLLERIVENEMRRQLQKMALQVLAAAPTHRLVCIGTCRREVVCVPAYVRAMQQSRSVA